MNATPGDDERDAVPFISRRRLIDIVAVGMVADDDKQAVGVFRLDVPDESRQFAVAYQ